MPREPGNRSEITDRDKQLLLALGLPSPHTRFLSSYSFISFYHSFHSPARQTGTTLRGRTSPSTRTLYLLYTPKYTLTHIHTQIAL